MQKIYRVLTVLLVVICFTGCSNDPNKIEEIQTSKTESNRFLKYEYTFYDHSIFGHSINLHIDKLTGCQYLNSDYSNEVQVLNANGTPYTDNYKKDKNRFSIEKDKNKNDVVITDNYTGVQYWYHSAPSYSSLSILMDKDGKPYTDK